MEYNVKKRIILLPSFPLNMLPFDREPTIKCVFESISLQELKVFLDFLKERGVEVEIHNYIRHKPTNDLLERVLAGYKIIYEHGAYKFDYRDLLYAITLKTRPPISGIDVEVKPEDLLVIRISVL